MGKVLFEDRNIKWIYSDDELETFRELWAQGADLWELCKALKRTKLDITLLIIDQAEDKEIKPRAKGVFGG